MNRPDSSYDTIRLQDRPICLLCGASGRELYRGLRDRLYSVPGEWRLRRCSGSSCHMVWMDPAPIAVDIPKLYPAGYLTHAAQSDSTKSAPVTPCDARKAWYTRLRSGWRNGPAPAARTGIWEWLGCRSADICRYVPGIDPASRHPELWLPRPSAVAELLDVGCGGGAFLADMRRCGWHVSGVEPDPTAARLARTEHALNVHQGTVETLPADDAYDATTLLHVIEHLPDPRSTLRRIWHLLRPGGRLLVVTPNGDSLGSRYFGRAWVHWEPPRHLQVFTALALERLLTNAGFALERQWTTGRNARWTWDASREIQQTGRCGSVEHPQSNLTSRWCGRLSRLVQNGMLGCSGLGEELVAVGVKAT